MRHIKFADVGKKINFFDAKNSKRKIDLIVVHCTATSNKVKFGAKRCDEEHLRRWGKNSGCGYHYVIRQSGQIELGRDVDFQGAHVKGHNKNSIGIAYEGGLYEDGRPKTEGLNTEQSKTLSNLITQIKIVRYSEIDIKGHNEMPNVNKACPCTSMKLVRDNAKFVYNEAMNMFDVMEAELDLF